MEFLLRIKAGQAFMLMFGANMMVMILNFILITIHSPITGYVQYLILATNAISFFSHILWMFVVVKEIDKRLPEELQVDTSIFTLVFYVILIPNIISTSLTFIGLFAVLPPVLNEVTSDFFTLRFFGMQFFTIMNLLSTVYFAYFLSKMLVSYQFQKRGSTFGDHMGYFFHFLVYPIGIWSLQPRINKLSGTEPDLDPEAPLDHHLN